MIYWTEYDNPAELLGEKRLDEMAKEYDTEIFYEENIKPEVFDWFNFGHIMSIKYKFNPVYESCFIYYLTVYFADEGLSRGAEDEYFVKKLDDKINDLYFDAITERDEQEQKKKFYGLLLNFFRSDDVKDYEKKVIQHKILVSDKIKEWFDNRQSTRDTIVGLMNGEIEKPHLNMNEESSSEIVFLLTCSEENRWYELSNISDADRLRVLLY